MMGRSRTRKNAVLLLCLTLVSLTLASCRSAGPRESGNGSGPAFYARTLGAWPLCEASAATLAPWDESSVLVADSHVRSHIWSFTLKDGVLSEPRALTMPRDHRPRDIEALAPVGDAILALGSHSLNSDCEIRPQRRRARLIGRGAADELEERGAVDNAMDFFDAMKDPPACETFLFAPAAPDGTRRICIALLLAQRAAVRGNGCSTIVFEGAFSALDGRTWLGLRAPQIDGAALLLRLAPGFDTLRFDDWALVDLGGRGIRALTLAGETLWGVAGPSGDDDDPFALFSLPVSALSGEGPQAARIVREDLPTSSEGIVVADTRAIIVVDGAKGERGSKTCASPSRQYWVPLPQG